MQSFKKMSWEKWLVGVLALMGLVSLSFLLSCNTEPEVEQRIDLYLPDSLSKDKNGYERIQVSLLNRDSSVFRAALFDGPYLAEPTGGVLKGLVVGDSLPSEFIVDILGFKGADTVHVQIAVKNKVPGPVVRIDTVKTTGGVVEPKPEKIPQGVVLNDSVLTLGLNSNPRRVYATLVPSTALGDVTFTSNLPEIAEVSTSGVISPRAVGEALIIAQVQGYPTLRDTVKVKVIVPPAISSVAFKRPVPTLYVGAPATTFEVSHIPENLTLIPEFSSSDEGVVSITSGGAIKALATGDAVLTVTASGTSVSDTVHVHAVKDPPLIDAGNDQSVAVGQPVVFKVKVTQAFGTLTLSWDFNGDGQPEGSTTQDTATASFTYTSINDNQVVFTAKDGEGNTTNLTRRIRVGKAGPLILVVSPKNDTLIRTTDIVVRYTVDGSPSSKTFTNLREELNTLWVKASNASGEDSVPVKVMVDTKAPVVKIGSPASGTLTNSPEIAVAWTVDDAAQNIKTKESLVGKQGKVWIYREQVDAAGNRGVDSIWIDRDTVPPAPPSFVGGDSSTNKKPTWAWVSSGTAGGGTGTFRWSLNTTPATTGEGTATQFTPTTDLADGLYTLSLQERDALGNWSDPVTRDIRVLTRGALVEITSPIRGSYTNVRGGVITVDWSVGGVKQNTQLMQTLTKEGGWNLIRREYTDAAKNLTFDTLSVYWDTTTPKVVITSPSNGASFDTQSVAVAWSVDGVVQTQNLTQDLGTTSGTKTITRSFTDAAGNTGTASVQVILDMDAPSAPAITLKPQTPARTTSSSALTWEWGGVGPYEWRLSQTNSTTGSGTAITAKTYTRTGSLGDGTWYFQVRERDAAGNWSPWTTEPLVIDNVAPGAPNVTRDGAFSKAPRWDWLANTTTPGIGQFRYRWSGPNPYIAEDVTTKTYSPASLAEAAHNLCVSERDAVGYGSETCVSITVDRTNPVIGGISPVSGFVTNQSSVTVTFTKDGAPGKFNCNLTADAAKSCDSTVYDAAGNPSTVSTTVWSRPNVIFVRAGAPAGGDGSSWDKALTNLGSILYGPGTKAREIWVSAGTYGTTNDQFFVGSNTKLYGGFASTGHPSSLNERNISANKTTLSNQVRTSFMVQGVEQPAENVVVGGFYFGPGANIVTNTNAYNVEIEDCTINDNTSTLYPILIYGTKITIRNCRIQNNAIDRGGIWVYGSGAVDIVGGIISRNYGHPWDAGGIYIWSGLVTISGGTVLFGNTNEDTNPQIKMFGGELTIDGCEIEKGRAGIEDNGNKVTYGNNKTL